MTDKPLAQRLKDDGSPLSLEAIAALERTSGLLVEAHALIHDGMAIINMLTERLGASRLGTILAAFGAFIIGYVIGRSG